MSQQLLARPQRQAIKVVAVEMDQIEEVVVDRDAARARLLGIRDLHSLLEPGETGHRTVESDDLAVGDEVGGALIAERLDEFRIGAADLLLVAAEQAHCPAVTKAERSLAVELPLEQPVGVREAPIGEPREHRRHPFRLRRLTQVLALGCAQPIDRAGHRLPSDSSPAPSALATSSIVRPERTDFGSVEVGFRRASASSSSILINSQSASLSSPIRCST